MCAEALQLGVQSLQLQCSLDGSELSIVHETLATATAITGGDFEVARATAVTVAVDAWMFKSWTMSNGQSPPPSTHTPPRGYTAIGYRLWTIGPQATGCMLQDQQCSAVL